MTLLRSNANETWLPADFGALITRPALDLSIAAQVCTIVQTGASSFRIPVLSADSVAHFVPEAGLIGTSDPTLAEVVCVPSKIAVNVQLSRELVDDATPESSAMVGLSCSRAISRALDQAFFGNTTADGQDGLLSLTTSTSVETATSFENLDAFASAVFTAESEGASITHFISSPDTVLALSTVKELSNSTRPLLTPDPTTPTSRSIYGRPLLVSKYIGPKVAWAVDSSLVFCVVRDGARVEVDRSVGFLNDIVNVKCTMRVGFAIAAHPLSIVKITHA